MEGKEGKFQERVRFQIMELDQVWKARGELKSSILDHAIAEGKSGTTNKELDFRSWHCCRREGWGEGVNEETKRS